MPRHLLRFVQQSDYLARLRKQNADLKPFSNLARFWHQRKRVTCRTVGSFASLTSRWRRQTWTRTTTEGASVLERWTSHFVQGISIKIEPRKEWQSGRYWSTTCQTKRTITLVELELTTFSLTGERRFDNAWNGALRVPVCGGKAFLTLS